ncbi:hypothetical protein B0H14DRAFT_3494271 [Mycena olivaceomarginata]|nr:hypothetical protein B0H14DRAFT_3494271 [Mycena olivaceomarginata]
MFSLAYLQSIPDADEPEPEAMDDEGPTRGRAGASRWRSRRCAFHSSFLSPTHPGALHADLYCADGPFDIANIVYYKDARVALGAPATLGPSSLLPKSPFYTSQHSTSFGSIQFDITNSLSFACTGILLALSYLFCTPYVVVLYEPPHPNPSSIPSSLLLLPTSFHPFSATTSSDLLLTNHPPPQFDLSTPA